MEWDTNKHQKRQDAFYIFYESVSQTMNCVKMHMSRNVIMNC